MGDSKLRIWLKEKRIKNNLSQKELAKLVDVAVSTINKYEIGIRTPKPHTAKIIAEILEFNWADFY